jgi:multidrug resistance efflux pump
VREGQKVKTGDTIAVLGEIKDDYFDPNLQKRLREQQESKESVIEAIEEQVEAIEKQRAALERAAELSFSKTQNKLTQSAFKVQSDSVDYINEKMQAVLSLKQYERAESLYHSQGTISLTDLEKRRQAQAEKQAKMISTQNKWIISKNELVNARIELGSVRADYAEKIAKATSELSAKRAYLADAQMEYSKLLNKLANVDYRVSSRVIRASQNGHIVKLLKAGIGENVKESDPIATIQPLHPALAAELYVRAMDVPLLSIGRKVRLQFEGWPSLQFAGWPSVSIGTFGGVVQVIDYVNSSDGSYRILVVPDPETEPWPVRLRMGSGVYAWALLDEVRVWYEIWRQLNGVPPSLKQAPDDDAQDNSKYGKAGGKKEGKK